MHRLLLSAKGALVTVSAGIVLAANSCLPQDYFATLAGEVVSQTVADVLARFIEALFEQGAAA